MDEKRTERRKGEREGSGGKGRQAGRLATERRQECQLAEEATVLETIQGRALNWGQAGHTMNVTERKKGGKGNNEGNKN